jgi:hypothetical protein
MAAAIRAYWDKFKDVPLEERWYQTLGDDSVPGRWLEAAGRITRGVKNKGAVRLEGERLRDKKEPSVTELMLKRIEFLRQSGAPGSEQMFRTGDACQMAYCLAEWDSKSSLPILARMVGVCREYLATVNPDDSNAMYTLGSAIAKLTQLRLKQGDAKALEEYAAWISAVDPKSSGNWMQLLQPMWQNPDDPAIATAAASMFNGEKSPWSAKFLRVSHTSGLFNSPMVGITSYCDRLLLELKNTSPAGRFELAENGSFRYEMLDGFNMSTGPGFLGDPRLPKAGTLLKFRVCDACAWGLSALEGAPHFEIYWPVPDRNRAIAACELFLVRFGDRFKGALAAGPWPPGWPYAQQVRMTFPRLDHPATTLEAHQGLALFALGNEEKTRVYQLPSYPLKAKWVTLKDFPYTVQEFNPKLKQSFTRTDFHQHGFVWQAEEVFRDGKWQRYFGFVGLHIVAKVPAAEIEFPRLVTDYSWRELSRGLDCMLSNPALQDDGNGVRSIVERRVGDPVRVQVKLRNRSGLEQIVPSKIVRPNGTAGIALHAGIQLRVRYTSAKDAKTAYFISPTRNEETDWQELKAKSNPRFNSGPATKTVAPAEEFADIELDLNDFFDMTKPGGYRVQLIFTTADGGFAEGATQEEQFALSAR